MADRGQHRFRLRHARPHQRVFRIHEALRDHLVQEGIQRFPVIQRIEQDDRIEHYLKKVTLWDEVRERLKSPASRLSIGQQQRLCLARGLAIEPKVILADEPTSALDPISSGRIEEQFQELSREFSIVLVTHILRQAKRLADYVAFMYFGEIIEKGRPAVMFEDPKTETFRQYLLVGH